MQLSIVIVFLVKGYVQKFQKITHICMY